MSVYRYFSFKISCLEFWTSRTIEEKKQLLYDHGIAVWDVIARCDIIGSSDSSIKNVVPNDMQVILAHAPIERIYANGGKAYELYMQYWQRNYFSFFDYEYYLDVQR